MQGAFPRPDAPLGGPAAWRGDRIARAGGEWLHEWTRDEIAGLERALAAVRATDRGLDRIARSDFPLSPSLAARLERLRRELLCGRGFALLRGLDTARYSRADLVAIFWGVGTHLGRALPQNARGDLLGHVADLGRDARDPSTRIYQTNQRQGYHTDSADIVGLMCVQPAREGGRSSIASCVTIHDELLARAPDLLGVLFEPFRTDHRGEHRAGAPPFFTAPILSWYQGELSVLYQRQYIESAQRFAEVPRLTDRQIAALDAFDAVADGTGVHLDLDLEAGDVLMLHNHQLVHDRTAFRDWPEPERRRHLLRLWLCPPAGRPLPPWFAERLGSTRPGNRGGVALEHVAPRVSLAP